MDYNLISSAKCYPAKYKCFLENFLRGKIKEARDARRGCNFEDPLPYSNIAIMVYLHRFLAS